MRRPIVAVVTVAALALALAAFLPAAAKGPSGKELYREYCKPCHGPNAPDGEYSPLTLIQDQWERFFDKKFERTHTDVEAPESSGTKLLDALDEETLQKIRDFAIDHAADSESPMTCG